MPWAKSFCPFRACCYGPIGHQGVLPWASGRAAVGFWASGRAAMDFKACCCGLSAAISFSFVHAVAYRKPQLCCWRRPLMVRQPYSEAV